MKTASKNDQKEKNSKGWLLGATEEKYSFDATKSRKKQAIT